MNAMVLTLRYPRLIRVIEPALYGALAIGLIGQAFVLEGMMNLPLAVAILSGTVAGLMTSCAAAPVTGWLLRLRNAGTAEVPQAATILPFVRGGRAAGQADDNRRAA